jgi:hypothetical protein
MYLRSELPPSLFFTRIPPNEENFRGKIVDEVHSCENYADSVATFIFQLVI